MRATWVRVLSHAILMCFAIGGLFPIVYALLTSFKPNSEVLTTPPTLLPHMLSLAAYAQVLHESPLLRQYLPNSLINAGFSAVLVVILASTSAYIFSRYRFVGSGALEWAVLGLMLLPSIPFIIPYYRLGGMLNLLNSHEYIIGIYTAWGLPFAIWILRSFIRAIPLELEEAALIDGCTQWQSLWFILLPLAAPGLVTAGLLVFIDTWNDFLLAVILLTGEARTATVGLYDFQTLYETRYDLLTAASIIMILPVLLIFLLLHRYFFDALLSGAVKH